MGSVPKPTFVSIDEYLAREEQTQTKSEYIDGWVRAMSGAMLRHNKIAGNCYYAFRNILKGKRCQPFNSDTKVRIDQPTCKRFYYPDIQVVCESNEDTSVFQDQPNLVIEVLSPSTRRYDLDEKMNAYLSIDSLETYIAFEQHQPIAIVMRRSENGFLRHVIEGTDAMIELPSFGSSLAMRDVYEDIEFTAECVQEPEEEYELR